jgi:hypothetical protein
LGRHEENPADDHGRDAAAGGDEKALIQTDAALKQFFERKTSDITPFN